MATSVKSVIGEVRFSYLHVFEPYSFDPSQEPKYSATLLIPKSDNTLVEKIKRDIKATYDAAVVDRWGGKKPPMDKVTPLRDGDEPNDDGEDRGPAYAGHYYLNCKSKQAPGVVGRDRKPIISTDDFYSGCYGYASVAFGAFDNNGNKGISCYLNNLMKSKDGDPLGGARTSAEEDFAGVDLGFDTSEEL